jgi:hypothetical protein
MAINPTVKIDWDGGEGRLDLGTRLKAEDPLFKADVLKDISEQARSFYEDACDEMFPGMEARLQKLKNQRRRHHTASLTGQTIKGATALRNGDVALQLSDGRVFVICAQDEDVAIAESPSMAAAIEYAAECPTDKYEGVPSKKEVAMLLKDGVTAKSLTSAGILVAAK